MSIADSQALYARLHCTVTTVREEDLEGTTCPDCGQGNVLDGVKRGCLNCRQFLAAWMAYRATSC